MRYRTEEHGKASALRSSCKASINGTIYPLEELTRRLKEAILNGRRNVQRKFGFFIGSLLVDKSK